MFKTRHFSNDEHAKRVALLQQQSMHVCPPAITFSRKKKKDKDTEDDKDECFEIDVPINPEDPEQTTERHVLTFEDGTAEEWIKWRVAFDNLAEEYPLDAADKKLRLLRALFRGEAKDKFETAHASPLNIIKGVEDLRQPAPKNLLLIELSYSRILGVKCLCYESLLLRQGHLETIRP